MSGHGGSDGRVLRWTGQYEVVEIDSEEEEVAGMYQSPRFGNYERERGRVDVQCGSRDNCS